MYIFATDGKRFPDIEEGEVRHANREHPLVVCKRSGISSPSPLQKKLFPSDLPSGEKPSDKDLDRDGSDGREDQLKAMAEQRERSCALMDQQLANPQAREDQLQRTVQTSVNQALGESIRNTPPHALRSPSPVPDRMHTTRVTQR